MVFSESDIISGKYSWELKLKSWIGGSFTANLCWRASRDGWSASTFHSNCDNKKPTVTIVKVGQYIFGGYATESWDGEFNHADVISYNFDFFSGYAKTSKISRRRFMSKKRCARVVRWYVSGRRRKINVVISIVSVF